MNPDVAGTHKNSSNSDYSEFLTQEFLQQYNLVIASELDDRELSKLSEITSSQNSTLIIINSYGFVARIRIQNGVHEIVESKPVILYI